MLDWQKIIKEEIEKCEMTTFLTEDGKGTYPYVILPFDGRIKPKFMKAVIKGMTLMLKDEIKRATTILLPEAKGFLLTPLIETTGLDLALVRKRNYRTPNQIIIKQTKAYKEGENLMYCIGLKKGDVPLIVDDIISSGGTQISIINALKKHGFDIAGVGSVFERENGVENIKKETGYDAKVLARLEIINNKPVISKIFGVV
ncbi:MAG: phosphoribosyltransferase family protein [Candidatus Aenigmarchaeota archaeon]|nr:phosphoribosyltransferase family protein [Candidatus Aenigmarchaeota archaeon]